MTIPLEESFTVVTGPNGSGKSNILDGILFCLGLATSRGMRADRLPDLVNSNVLRDGKAAETIVSVRFDLSDWQPDPAEEGLDVPEDGPWIKQGQKEWSVSRRLRVMPGGSYSSSYTCDDEPCNLQQLQTQLRRLRIDPEGSNVVMQGDVTRIVSMSNRDRRGLIDELAGVALFDNRIEQSRKKLDVVQEREERCRIVEQELVAGKHKLERDCAKARNYQELKENFLTSRLQEQVLSFEAEEKNLINLKSKQKELLIKEGKDTKSISENEQKLILRASELKSLQENVKSLGEDQLIKVQAELAGLETQSRELDRQASKHQEEGQKLQTMRHELASRRQKLHEEHDHETKESSTKELELAETRCKNAQAAVEVSRRRLADVAGKSGELLETQQLRIEKTQNLQRKIFPLQQEQQKLEERIVQDQSRKKELELDQERDQKENEEVHDQLNRLETEWEKLLSNITAHNQQLSETSHTLNIQQRTKIRLENEQTKLEKEIARLESRSETLHESRGTHALHLLLKQGLEGIHGPVSQLGEVEEVHRLALEVAAGARLGQIVVENDQIAAKAIELLKKNRAGRLTFLPLNRIRKADLNINQALRKGTQENRYIHFSGLIDKAFNLVNFEPIYANVFSYVFGETLVFRDLDSARQQIGTNRSVTLDGELLEKSGAMTGGNFSRKGSGLSFGKSIDNDETAPLRRRLLEVGEALVACSQKEAHQNQELNNLRSLIRNLEQRQAALDAERTTAQKANNPVIARSHERLARLKALEEGKTKQEMELNQIKSELKPILIELETINQEERVNQPKESGEGWEKLERELQDADSALLIARKEKDELMNKERQRELNLARFNDQSHSLNKEENRLKESVQNLAKSHLQWKEQQKDLVDRQNTLEKEEKLLHEKIGEQRRARDLAETQLATQREKHQEAQWKLERLKDDLVSLQEELRSGELRVQELRKELPAQLPEIPKDIRELGLDALRVEMQKIQNRMEELEPVNMLALQELEELESRLTDLGEKLEVLNQERAELLLRIENVATLRQEAFMEAFEAVDKHFREIFANLSDGDGHLQLDNSEDPLEGGLTLVAHPKGKTVRRLAAMSGGEKSLTALSFLFALQRFRPSPFYALDEVDSFLDGINVERLASLISRQAEEAQFLVVSHRRPMIGASTRTIGVTQARGSNTQVVGLPQAA